MKKYLFDAPIKIQKEILKICKNENRTLLEAEAVYIMRKILNKKGNKI